ncbi:MAG: PAS domain-containing sensor histidine kinase [Fidelibacterota bacterium]
MNSYRYTGNIKAGLFVLGIALVVGLLIYSQRIVSRLREENREIVKLYAEIIAKSVSEENEANLGFIFDEIIKKVQFPIIYSDNDQNPIYFRNLDTTLSTQGLIQVRRTMDQQNPPIPLWFVNPETGEQVNIGYLHYGDSDLIRQLTRLPYLEIGAVALFILLGFIGFTVIRNSEKRSIWVGMARETAHQLATPVSALMGWVSRLQSHPEKSTQIIAEMESDLRRLQQVGDRFSKIGSETSFKEINLSRLVEEVISYLRRRLPSEGETLTITNHIDPGVTIKANGVLISWAIENVIKNGIDAMSNHRGSIDISLYQEPQKVVIRISDSGCGVPRREWRNIFRPGYSTKEQGWGLGLSLTQRIIRDIHKGTIRIVESAPGRGTVFEIILPQ